MKSTMILKRRRSDEEKLRRHLHGDKGAKFSGGNIPCVDGGGIIGAITTMVTKDILLLEIYEQEKGQDTIQDASERQHPGLPEQGGQAGISEAQFINPNNIAPTVIAEGRIRIQEFMAKRYRIRKLTPTECFRLMGVDDEGIEKMRERVSDSQCYKLAGNSIVVDVLVWGIFKPLLLDEPEQTTLF